MTLLEQNYDVRSYAFIRTNGTTASGNLGAPGSKSISFTSLPFGLAVGKKIYISGGSGTAEAVPVTALSGTPGAVGTVTVTTSNIHTGAWVVSSASGGIQEAIIVANNVGTLELPPKTIDVYAPIVLPTTINLIGHGTSIVAGVSGSILRLHGSGPCIVDASGVTDSLTAQYGVGIRRNLIVYSPDVGGQGVWTGGDPSNVICPSTWQGDYVNWYDSRILTYSNSLVFQIGDFNTYTNCNFSSLHDVAFLVPITAQGLQYVNFYSCVMTVGSGNAVQMDASSSGSGQIIFHGGQISGTITGQSLHWHSFGTHYEPNDNGAIVTVNNHTCSFKAYGGLMGTHNIASGVGYQMFFNTGAGLAWVVLDGIEISDTASNIARWCWFQTEGILTISGVTYFPKTEITQLYSLDGGGGTTGLQISQGPLQRQTVAVSATITWDTGNINFPNSGVIRITGATLGGSGITNVAGLLEGQSGTIITDNPQTFTTGGLIGNTRTTVSGLPYTFAVHDGLIWIGN